MALSADRQVSVRNNQTATVRLYPVDDSALIYKGALVNINSEGLADAASDTSGERCVGIALDHFDNTGAGHADGASYRGMTGVRVQSGCEFLLPTDETAQTDVGKMFEIEDDQLVGDSGDTSNHVKAGVVTEYVDATHVWIFIPALGVIGS